MSLILVITDLQCIQAMNPSILSQMQPRNTEYKPTCIDSGAVFQVKDDQNKQINIYWSIPPKSFGNISYKIVTNNEQNHHEIETISSLPYDVQAPRLEPSYDMYTT
eukprot:735149_1